MARVLFILGLAFCCQSFAHHQQPVSETAVNGSVPPCMAGKQELPIDDQEVLGWKTSTKNQFLARAHVEGTLTKVYADETGHAHFEIELGSGSNDGLEVIYNLSFGALPQLHEGMHVEACGDYITSNAPAGGYQASPDGAIIHWIHKSNDASHDSGFLAIDGVVYGEGNGY